jgi:hypothetical protein
VIENYCGVGKPTLFETDFLRDITHPGTLDVNGNNTIVIISTLPDTLGLATFLTFSPLLYSVAKTITNGKKYDKNNDGFLSAEEIFRIAWPPTLIQSSFMWIFLFIYDWSSTYLYYKFILYPHLSSLPPFIKKIYDRLLPKPIVIVTFTFPFSYLFFQIFSKYIYGHYALNWPNMEDDYPGELPLVQL